MTLQGTEGAPHNVRRPRAVWYGPTGCTLHNPKNGVNEVSCAVWGSWGHLFAQLLPIH